MTRLEEAYEHCEALTRAQAANFYWGIRLLAPERRRALSAAYAFAREVDDIGDGSLPPDAKLRALEQARASLTELELDPEGTSAERDLTMTALADAHRGFELPLDAFAELIEGVRMDVRGASYETFEELVVYCRRVAGAVGRVCLAIFGQAREAPCAGDLADDLGVALQLTNILRDVREDAERGRVYLPGEDLRRFGLLSDGAGIAPAAQLVALAAAPEDGGGAAPSAGGNGASGEEPGHQRELALEELVRFEADRAEEWFERGLTLIPALDRRSAACVLAMAGIYRRLLARIRSEPRRALSRRVSLPAREKAWVAARAMLGSGT